jgi:RNA polymerase sigma-70 factor (ECF subfamily)
VFERYAPRVYHLARRMLGNADDAEDVTQDVFVQVLRKLPAFRGEASFPTWLYRVTVNAALNYRRKRGRHPVHSLDDGPLEDFHEDGRHRTPIKHWTSRPVQHALDQETHELIEQAIAGLPEAYRDVVVLADVEERPTAEVAGLLGLSETAVKGRLHRARLLMRKALAPHFEERAA